ncbi:hypothetical protein [Streptomyces mashuensis]|uniref:hypothetical protein n=1 Tax=Streptomyces mashuensis TaxID=33904 RepID=UPI00167EFE6F|nr:hypothetical protein [Streptomyces mashuensis]
MRSRTRARWVAVVAVAVCGCIPLAACGTERAGTPGTAASAPDGTSDDQHTNLPDTTSDDQHTDLPDTTSDDQHTDLPDTTSDDHPDPDGPPMGDTADDDGGVPTAGPHRWFPMLQEFRTHLTTKAPKPDAAVAPHVTRVYVRTPAGTDRVEAVVRVDYGVGEQEDADRTAKAFTQWRRTVYGDHGHVRVLGPAKTTAEQTW